MNKLWLLAQFVFLMVVFQVSVASGAVREYYLTVSYQDITIREQTAAGMTINGDIPGPTLYFQKGDLARIHVKNTLSVGTSIHWHGLLVPADMDGVPFVTQQPIAPGQTFVYEFPIRQTGTYWYHSHSGLQEQRGLYGSIVIQDEKHPVDRDYVVLLSDWTTESPDSVLRTLKRGSHWYALEKGAAQSIFGAVKAGKVAAYFKRELQRMPPMDIADVAYDYFLSNGKPETFLAARGGDRVRLRIINGSATTYFHLSYSGGLMTIISADGQLVQPVRKDLFLIGVAETYDVLLTIPKEGRFEFRATAHDGSGFTSTWLGEGKKHFAKDIPLPDLYEPMAHAGLSSVMALTPAGVMGMSDAEVATGMFDSFGSMHMDQGHGSQHGGMGREKAMPGKHGMNQQAGEENSVHASEHGDAGLVHGRMRDTAMSEKMVPNGSPPVMESISVTGDSHVSSAKQFGSKFGILEPDISSRPHLAVEGGPDRLATPYADLRSPEKTALPADAPVREVRLTLDGDMERYTWFLNNKPISESDSIRIREGEVVRFIMINRTMMHHPMHLHGHFFRVLNGQGDRSPLKHTVDVAPMSTTVIEFYGDEFGDWFFHCHLLYHMKSGMARYVHYEGFTPAPAVSAVRGNLKNEPLYFYGVANVLTNMTEGELTFANSRYSLAGSWEAGWQEVTETDWETTVLGRYHLNRFSSFLGGVDVLGESSSSEHIRAVIGIDYLLPFYVESSFWADSDGGVRLMLEKEFELTPRFALHGEIEYDSHKDWESKVGLTYLVSKSFSISANYHSEFGAGVGVQIRF